ncbi:hypothetical protein BJX99DRAFT_258384 [Aspergillus californicus]
MDQHEMLVRMSESITLRRKQLASSIARLYHTPQFEDLVVICEAVEFPCNKAIVCAQSGTIRDLCGNAFVAGERCILRVRCQPLVFHMALEYLYTCDYHFFLDWDFPTKFPAYNQTVPADTEDRLDCCELSLHLQVYILAKCLRIPGLRYLSAYKVVSVLERTSFSTVFLRFVREVYGHISAEESLLKSLVIGYANRVIYR